MSIGVWWKVEDVEKYVFKIYSDQSSLRAQVNPYVPSDAPMYPNQVAQAQPKAGAARFDSVNLHRIADQWLRVVVESTIRQQVNQLAVADVVSSQAMEFLKTASDSHRQDDLTRLTIFDTALADALREVQTKSSDFGLLVEKMEVQHVYLPKAIQDAINETRIAFLAPIKGEREAEAQRISLEKLVSVLGRDNVALNQIMSNLKNANIVTPLPIFQPMLDKFNALSNSEQSTPPPPLPPPPPPKPKSNF